MGKTLELPTETTSRRLFAGSSDIPLITIAVPSYNQGGFLEQALDSIFSQDVPLAVYVADGGSTDNTLEIIDQFRFRLAGFRSYPDDGQAAAINECLAQATTPYVCWLNSDDYFLPQGLKTLHDALSTSPNSPMVYGKAWNYIEAKHRQHPVWVQSFSERRLARRCIISQPATLIRKSVWDLVGGVNPNLHMAMDYDVWWRIFKMCGEPLYLDQFVAVNREHAQTKTSRNRRLHYQEAMATVRKHHGRLPIKWFLYQPYAVWYKSFF